MTAWAKKLLSARRPADVAFAVVVLGYVVLVTLPWWSTKLLPLMDYPMFLSFVRVFLDHGDPGSPFHGTYTLGPPVSPLVLPIAIVAGLAKLTGSIETAGRVAWTAFALGLPAAAAFTIRSVKHDRWNIVLVFPLVFGKWTSSGFFGFVTAMPLVLVTWALAIRFLHRGSRRLGVGVALCLIALVEWHAIATAQALLGLGIIWLCWRAPDWRARLLRLWPLLVPAVLVVTWTVIGFGAAPTKAPPSASRFVWEPLAQMFDTQTFFSRILMLYPTADVYAKLLALSLVVVAVLGPRARPWAADDAPTNDWHVRNPLAVIAVVALLCFFLAPAHVLPAEVVGQRFGWMAAVFTSVAWCWPERRLARALGIALLGALGAAYLWDINVRFRAFHRETIGASRLIDALPKDATLIAPMRDNETRAFMNHPVREVQQYATIRNGVLPTTSFAGYGVNYVRFVDKNPKPQLFPHNWLGHPQLTEFDAVLLRRSGPAERGSPRLRLVREDGEWALFDICGSKKTPTCR